MMEIAGLPVPVFCGVDWAEDHHDVALVDAGGTRLAKLRISDDAAGFTQLTALLTEHGDSKEHPIPVAIETSRGLLVACLRATGRPVFAINPLAVARYRDRHSVARKKSDAIDAAALANILRTDMAAHRPLPQDSELAQAIAVLALAQQDAVWDRGQAHNKLRSQLREFYPAILAAFADKREGICSPEAGPSWPRPRRPRRRPVSRADVSSLCSGRLDVCAASNPRPPDFTRFSAVSTSTNHYRLRRPSAGRPRPCCVSWRPPAPTPTSWKLPPGRRSSSTPTPRSSAAFRAWAH
ncbi:hypothetical protein QFZ82_000113 [Streptomyces sp. V4I23]|nr:hypothetical protein [Streptomyces sp. V4I23]